MINNLSLTHNELPRLHRGSFAYWGVAILMAALYGALSWLTPYSLDDWIFMASWRDDVDGGYDFSFPIWRDYYLYTREYDNGRIANGVAPIFTMFSPWKEFFPIITGLLLAFTAVLLQRFSTGKASLPALGATWALMIVSLPWRDTIFVRDYSLNYLWASALTLGLLWELRSACHGKKHSTFTVAALLAVVAGGWHEGFAVTTLCGLFLLALKKRFRLPMVFYVLILIYLISTLAFMISPGLLNRIDIAEAAPHPLPSIRTYFVLIVVALLAIYLLASRRYSLKLSDAAVVAIGIIVSGYILAYRSTNTPRSYFWPDMAAVGLALHLLKEAAKTLRISVRMLATAGWIIVVCCTAQTISSIIWQNRYLHQTKEIMTMLDNSVTGTVFYDLKLPLHPPFYTFGMPVGHMWRSPWHYWELWSYYMTPVIGVVPTDLKEATPSPLTPRYPSKMKTGTSQRKVPEIIDGQLAIPFISESGDTLVYYTDF